MMPKSYPFNKSRPTLPPLASLSRTSSLSSSKSSSNVLTNSRNTVRIGGKEQSNETPSSLPSALPSASPTSIVSSSVPPSVSVEEPNSSFLYSHRTDEPIYLTMPSTLVSSFSTASSTTLSSASTTTPVVPLYVSSVSTAVTVKDGDDSSDTIGTVLHASSIPKADDDTSDGTATLGCKTRADTDAKKESWEGLSIDEYTDEFETENDDNDDETTKGKNNGYSKNSNDEKPLHPSPLTNRLFRLPSLRTTIPPLPFSKLPNIDIPQNRYWDNKFSTMDSMFGTLVPPSLPSRIPYPTLSSTVSSRRTTKCLSRRKPLINHCSTKTSLYPKQPLSNLSTASTSRILSSLLRPTARSKYRTLNYITRSLEHQHQQQQQQQQLPPSLSSSSDDLSSSIRMKAPIINLHDSYIHNYTVLMHPKNGTLSPTLPRYPRLKYLPPLHCLSQSRIHARNDKHLSELSSLHSLNNVPNKGIRNRKIPNMNG